MRVFVLRSLVSTLSCSWSRHHTKCQAPKTENTWTDVSSSGYVTNLRKESKKLSLDHENQSNLQTSSASIRTTLIIVVIVSSHSYCRVVFVCDSAEQAAMSPMRHRQA